MSYCDRPSSTASVTGGSEGAASKSCLMPALTRGLGGGCGVLRQAASRGTHHPARAACPAQRAAPLRSTASGRRLGLSTRRCMMPRRASLSAPGSARTARSARSSAAALHLHGGGEGRGGRGVQSGAQPRSSLAPARACAGASSGPAVQIKRHHSEPALTPKPLPPGTALADLCLWAGQSRDWQAWEQ